MKFRLYPRYKPSGVEWLGEVPEHWELPPLANRYTIELEKMLNEGRISGEHLIPYLRNIDVQWDRINTKDLPEMDIAQCERERFTVLVGDLLVCEGGDIGRAAIVAEDGANLGFQKALHRLRIRNETELPRYLFYTLAAASSGGGFLAVGNTNTIPHLTAEKLRRYRFPVPPLSEQRAIAAFLDRETGRINALVAKKRKLIERLKEKRTALISRTVTRGLPPAAARAAGLPENPPLKPSGLDWLGDIPAHWEVRKFSREVTIAEGQVDPEKEPYASMILIGPEHVESGTGRLLQRATAADQAAESGKYLSRKGDVIYSKIRPALRKLVIAPEDCLCSADMYPMRGLSRVNNRFIAWFFLSGEFSGWSVLESDRVAMPKINRDTLNELRLPVPPLSEQTAIVAFLDKETAKLDALVAKVETAIERLQEYRTALITAAVTGKIDVRRASERDMKEADA